MKTPTLVTLGLAAALLASCQTITQAPEGSPRIEVEVLVDVHPSFTEPVDGLDEEFAAGATQEVLSRADLGLRFYPVATIEYGEDDVRPEHFMTVQLKDLVVDLDHDLIEEKDQEPRIETRVAMLRCTVEATVKKRRDHGPALTVGAATRDGSSRATRVDRLPETAVTYELVHKGGDGSTLRVARSDLDRAFEDALAAALRGLLEPVDRELALR